MLKSTVRRIVITLAFCFACHSYADDSVPSLPDDATLWDDDGVLLDEEEMLYGATKYIKHLYEAPASATVITAQEIEKMGAFTLADVLERVPGLAISRTTPYGKRSIVVRGAKNSEGDLVLFNIDNHAMDHASTGSAAWQLLDMQVHNIKRIEVIRGPGSALYGANAATAVINILTKNGNIIDGYEARVSGGSFDKRELSLLAGKRFDDWDISALVNYSKRNASDTFISSDLFGSSGYADDKKEKTELQFKVNRGPYYANLYYNKQRNGSYIGADSALNDDSNLKSDQLFLMLSHDEFLTHDIHLRSTLHYDRWRVDFIYEIYPEGATRAFPAPIGNVNYPDGAVTNLISNNTNIGFESQLDVKKWDNHTLTFGFVWQVKELYEAKSISNYNPATFAPLGETREVAPWASEAKRIIKALYVQEVMEIGDDIEATFGVRYDHYSDFGKTINPRAAFVWQFSPGTYYKLLYGRAFKAPNFQELFIKNNPVVAGNDKLEPSIISTLETSINHKFAQNISGGLTLFRTEIKDIIDVIARKYKNSGEHKFQGIEAELQIGSKRSDNIYTNYTYTDAEDVIADSALPGAAKHHGNIGFNIKLLPNLHWNANLTYSSKLKRAPGDTRSDISSSKILDTAFILSDTQDELYLKTAINNLTDEEYESPDATGALMNDFPHLGRVFSLEAGIRFQ